MISHSFIVLLTISFFSIAVIQAKASIREGYDKIITEESLVQEKDNPEFYEPTPEELSRGVAFAPPSYWGVLLRKKKSLRIAFIGGSQTAYSWSYTYIFKSSMEKISNEMNWTFAVYNEGQVGHAPEARSFNFFKLNQSLWPNVIGIEPCLNCVGSEPYPCSSWIDNMKYFINGIYRSSGLDLPYYIFLEFFGADENYRQNNKHWNDITTKVALPINQTKVQELSDPTAKTMINRGTPYGPYMMALARFYAIPVLSVTEILFPSFVRFHITHVEYERWPYTQDGIHASPLGCEIFVKHVMVPFFMSQMTPRDSDNIYESKPRFGPYDPVDVRMLPPKHYSDIMILGKCYTMYVYICLFISIYVYLYYKY